MNILPKLIRENSVLRSSQNVREYIMKQLNPRDAANAIIKELGVEKNVPSLYDARITAMNMVSDYIRLGCEFDQEASFEHGMSRAQLLRKEYPYFAKEEDKMDTVIDNVNTETTVAKVVDPAVLAAKRERDAARKREKRAAEKAAKTVKVEKVKTDKVKTARGSKREMAREIYLANKEAPTKMVVDLIAEALQTTKSNAYVYLYHIKKAK